MSEKKKTHVGPGKKIISIYADSSELRAIKARATGLGLSVSQYFQLLARLDISQGGNLSIKPITNEKTK